jgi:hypothetical protein
MHKGLFSCEELAEMLAEEFVLADGTPATVEDLRRSLGSSDFIGYRPRVRQESNFSMYVKNVMEENPGIAVRKFPAFADLYYSDSARSLIEISKPSRIIRINAEPEEDLGVLDLSDVLGHIRAGRLARYDITLVKSVSADFKESPYGVAVNLYKEYAGALYRSHGRIYRGLLINDKRERINVLMKLNADFDGEWD